MVIQDEDFLVRNGNRFNLNASLPLRLQKRQLLKSLELPGNDVLIPCLASDKSKTRTLFKKYSAKGFPFLILVSEKPSRTSVPPLFLVNAKDEIIWRDDNNQRAPVSYLDALRLISCYKPTTWLEFSNYIWGMDTIAGRIAFISSVEQILELQLGIIPSQLLLRDDRNLPVYSGLLDEFKLQMYDYKENVAKLKNIGYQNVISFATVCSVAKNLSRYFNSFQELAKVSLLPTLEFGIVKGQLICIDIDWPSQWKEV